MRSGTYTCVLVMYTYTVFTCDVLSNHSTLICSLASTATPRMEQCLPMMVQWVCP